MNLYTIGYQGLTVEGFVALMKENGIQVVIDVRQNPISCYHGFSKRLLKYRLSLHHIGYDHIRELGAPTEIRDAFKRDHDWAAYAEAYLKYLDGCRPALYRIHSLIKPAGAQLDSGLSASFFPTTVCLMCFEYDASQCHRSLIAHRLVQLCWPDNLQIVNL